MSGIEWLRVFSFLRLHTDQSSQNTDTNSIEGDSASLYPYGVLEVKKMG